MKGGGKYYRKRKHGNNDFEPNRYNRVHVKRDSVRGFEWALILKKAAAVRERFGFFGKNHINKNHRLPDLNLPSNMSGASSPNEM